MFRKFTKYGRKRQFSRMNTCTNKNISFFQGGINMLDSDINM